MRYGKRWILLLTAVLTLAAGLIRLWEPEEQPQESAPEIPLSVLVTADGRTEEIDCWKNGEADYTVFLPSYTDLSETQLFLKDGLSAQIDGQPLKNGMSCRDFQLEVPYTLEYSHKKENGQVSLTFVRSGNVATMHIEVQSGTMDYIHQQKGNEESGRIRIYQTDGSLVYSGNLKTISGRGNATWSMEKKPYSLVLAGEANLLGLGKAQRWVLFANAADPSHLRNKFVFDYAGEAGLAYSPESAWVDLYLNGEYAGLYLLSERNEIHPQRVALEENNSFLVSVELGWRLEDQGYPFLETNNGSALRIHHSSVTETRLRERWQSAENAILAEDGIDPVTGKSWTELIDVDSWVKKYLIEEIFGSVDASAVSQYFYGDGEQGKIYAGPVWDYDISMGNAAAWQLSQPEAFFASRAKLRLWAEDPWFYALYRKEEFHDLAVEQYRTVFQPLLEEFLDNELTAYAARIEQAAEIDRYRWQTWDASAETEAIRDYMTQRMEFLSSVWLEEQQWYTVLVDVCDGGNTACYAVRPGDLIPELPNAYEHWNPVGWYHRETDTPVDLSQPVTENLDIYLKYPESESGSEEENTDSESRIPIWTKAPAFVLGMILLILGVWDLLRQRARTRGKKTERKQ